MHALTEISYKDKLEALRNVQWGERYRAKDFYLQQLALSKSHPDYEGEYLAAFPKVKKYIEDLFIMFRKQLNYLPEMDREIKRIQAARRVKEIKDLGQFSLID